MAIQNNVETISIKPIDIRKATIRIVGDSPLIMHAWSEKAKRMMLEAQQGKAILKSDAPPCRYRAGAGL